VATVAIRKVEHKQAPEAEPAPAIEAA
jgi:hypothetical protein